MRSSIVPRSQANIIVISFSLILTAFALASDDTGIKRSKFWPFYLEVLDQLSPGLAILEADSFYMETIYCPISIKSSSLKTNSALPSDENKELDSFLGEIKAKEKAICSIALETAKDTKKIAEISLRNKNVPSEGYLFFAFDTNLSVYEKEKPYTGRPLKEGSGGLPIGLFQNLQACQKAEDVLREVDFGTKSCRPWQETWLGKMRTSLMEIQKKQNEVDYEEVTWKIVEKILIAVFIYWIYYAAKFIFSATPHERTRNYLKGLGAALILALISWNGYGTHKEDVDPIYGGGYTVVDFVPTKKERNEYGLFVFFVTLLPIWYGTYKVHSGETVERNYYKHSE